MRFLKVRDFGTQILRWRGSIRRFVEGQKDGHQRRILGISGRHDRRHWRRLVLQGPGRCHHRPVGGRNARSTVRQRLDDKLVEEIHKGVRNRFRSKYSIPFLTPLFSPFVFPDTFVSLGTGRRDSHAECYRMELTWRSVGCNRRSMGGRAMLPPYGFHLGHSASASWRKPARFLPRTGV